MTFAPLPDLAPGATPPAARALARRRARVHTRLVRVLRWALPTLILALLCLLGAYVAAEAMRAARSAPREAPTEIRMISPHFVGRDDQGRAFDLTARSARREDTDLKRILLAWPVMKLDVESPHPKLLTADAGVFDEDTRLLRLDGHVRADDAAASTVGAPEALVDTRAGTVTGVSGVSGAGPMGRIDAASYTADQKQGVVVMRGGVHAVLNGR